MSKSIALLRKVLLLDAVTCLGAGLLMLLGGEALSEPLGLSARLLHVAGVSLLPFAAYLVYVARRAELPRSQVWVIVAANALWVLDSALILATGWVQPTLLGYAFVIGQALAVLVLAQLELSGVRRLSGHGVAA